MKAPRIDAFIPKKKQKKGLKSPLDNMPVIEKPSISDDDNELRESVFFKGSKKYSNEETANYPTREKIEKYTTHLEPSLVKKIKVHASEQDMKDYQVVKNALMLYFEKFKNK